jgi:hypothetical protein
VARYIQTIGVDYGVKPASVPAQPGSATLKDVRINFFDLAGLDAYADIRSEFYKDAQGVSASGAVECSAVTAAFPPASGCQSRIYDT